MFITESEKLEILENEYKEKELIELETQERKAKQHRCIIAQGYKYEEFGIKNLQNY